MSLPLSFFFLGGGIGCRGKRVVDVFLLVEKNGWITLYFGIRPERTFFPDSGLFPIKGLFLFKKTKEKANEKEETLFIFSFFFFSFFHLEFINSLFFFLNLEMASFARKASAGIAPDRHHPHTLSTLVCTLLLFSWQSYCHYWNASFYCVW